MKTNNIQTDPHEICRIYKQNTIDQLYLARDITLAYAKTRGINLNNLPFDFYVLVSVVMQVGKEMGIRQERERRRRKKNDNRITMV